MDLIFLHVPKCAGTSLREALVAAYRPGEVYLDNDDHLLDPQAAVNVDRAGFLQRFAAGRGHILRGKRVAHGHFCLEKYRGVPGPRATILREPVDRLISHYFFWKGLAPCGHGLHDRFLAEKPTLLEFAREPGLRYFYSRAMFAGVDMAEFDLIGSTERMGAAIAGLDRLIGRKLAVKKSNENTFEGYWAEREQIRGDSALLGQLRELLAEDAEFYERWVERMIE